MKKSNTYREIWKSILDSKNPIAATHYGIDPDSVASCKALWSVLKELKHPIKIISGEEVPNYTQRIVDIKDIEVVDVEKYNFSQHDLYIGLDMADEFRCSGNTEFKLPKNLKKINIDHHHTTPNWGDLNVIENEPSTSTILYKIFTNQKVRMSKRTANYLMAGILSDSGIFQFNNVKPPDLRIAADLMELGADMFNMIWNITFNTSLETYKIKSILYTNLKKEKDFAYSTITNKELINVGVDPSKNNLPVSDSIKQLEGVKFVFTVKEEKDGLIHAGFRAHEPNFDTTLISKPLGGGGHKPASGAILKDAKTVEEGVKIVLDQIKKILNPQEVHN